VRRGRVGGRQLCRRAFGRGAACGVVSHDLAAAVSLAAVHGSVARGRSRRRRRRRRRSRSRSRGRSRSSGRSSARPGSVGAHGAAFAEAAAGRLHARVEGLQLGRGVRLHGCSHMVGRRLARHRVSSLEGHGRVAGVGRGVLAA